MTVPKLFEERECHLNISCIHCSLCNWITFIKTVVLGTNSCLCPESGMVVHVQNSHSRGYKEANQQLSSQMWNLKPKQLTVAQVKTKQRVSWSTALPVLCVFSLFSIDAANMSRVKSVDGTFTLDLRMSTTFFLIQIWTFCLYEGNCQAPSSHPLFIRDPNSSLTVFELKHHWSLSYIQTSDWGHPVSLSHY